MAGGLSDYRKREERKRNLRSLGITLLIYLLIFSAYWGWSHFFRKELTLNQGPVLIRLGEPEGIDEPTPPAPEEDTPQEKQPEPEEPNPPVEETPAEQPLPEPDPVLPADTPSEPVETPEETAPVEEPVVKTPPAPPEPVRGSEAGNNWELNSEGGDIGRSLWVPIYLYMPLPQTIPEVFTGDGGLEPLLDQVRDGETGIPTADVNRKTLLRWYDSKQGKLLLKSPVPLQYREELWTIMERAGYDLREADYRKLPNLRAATIYFAVEPSGSTRANELTDLELKKSSGYQEIDEAILYAFEKSSYYTDADEPVKGRFTYRFY